MRKTRLSRRHLIFLCLTIPAILAAGPALAEMKKIPPMAFKLMHHQDPGIKTPGWLGSQVATSSFMAPVQLPLGATIDSVSFYYTAAGGAHATMYLGYFDSKASVKDLKAIVMGANVLDAASPTLSMGDFVPGADTEVKPGYQYMVWFNIDPKAFVWETRVSYTPAP